ncbi:MAG: hypothetical protein CMF70_06805 [Magnetovibrio sp.]|nr:hypothetical protein [Magnetovibrio sp.]|tara:strand:+ start:3082 stop:3336 length:255 start_codon:yes stop_codon:yes gene_type:complete
MAEAHRLAGDRSLHGAAVCVAPAHYQLPTPRARRAALEAAANKQDKSKSNGNGETSDSDRLRALNIYRVLVEEEAKRNKRKKDN